MVAIPTGKTNKIRRANNHPIDKIVDAISEQIHVAHRMDGMVGFQGVLVSPEEKLFKNKEYEYASQDIKRCFDLCLEISQMIAAIDG